MTIGTVAVLGLSGQAIAAPDNRSDGLFGTREFRSGNPAVVAQWDGVLHALARDAPAIAACDADPAECGSRRVRLWRESVGALRGEDRLAQLDAINRFANDIVPYRTDERVYRREDHWAAPLQMLRQAGDCEDYAILKFTSLMDLGVRNDQMRIVVVHDTVRDLPHAVLVVELEGGAYVLDNQFDRVLPLEGIGRYRPYFSVNLTHHWAHVALLADADPPSSKSAKASRMGIGWL